MESSARRGKVSRAQLINSRDKLAERAWLIIARFQLFRSDRRGVNYKTIGVSDINALLPCDERAAYTHGRGEAARQTLLRFLLSRRRHLHHHHRRSANNAQA
jgi:hypothetical protein